MNDPSDLNPQDVPKPPEPAAPPQPVLGYATADAFGGRGRRWVQRGIGVVLCVATLACAAVALNLYWPASGIWWAAAALPVVAAAVLARRYGTKSVLGGYAGGCVAIVVLTVVGALLLYGFCYLSSRR